MLETEIIKLREAIEALTAALTAAPVDIVREPKATQGASKKEIATPEQDRPVKVVSLQDVKDAVLSASRSGHKDAIREKLDSLGAKKLPDIAAEDLNEFYDWVITLGGDV